VLLYGCVIGARQVFPKSGWAQLFNALKKSISAGGPAYHLAEYTVLDNPYQAVHGGWQVGVVTAAASIAAWQG